MNTEAKELAVISVAEQAPVPVEVLRQQVQAIQSVMQKVMQKDVHFGVIPGTGKKPSLLKAGAEKICMLFRLIPEFNVTRNNLARDHVEYEVICTLKNPRGEVMGQGVGLCSTMESKYRWRQGARACPSCGCQGTIIKGKAEYGGGWLCFAKKGGCGQKFDDGDTSIESQNVDKIENPDLADQYNTVLKMAKKRAHVDATITATAASDIFTQDVEDMPQHERAPQPPQEPSALQEIRDAADGGDLSTIANHVITTAGSTHGLVVKDAVAQFRDDIVRTLKKFRQIDQIAIGAYLEFIDPENA